MIWNPGDGTDLNEGGDGIDTVEVNGGNGAETFTATANGHRVRFDRVTPAPFSLDIGTHREPRRQHERRRRHVHGRQRPGLPDPAHRRWRRGQRHHHRRRRQRHADRRRRQRHHQRRPRQRHGPDGRRRRHVRLEPRRRQRHRRGQGGNDTLLFNGANVDENIDLSANGSRVRFSRDVGNVTMDINGVEQVNFNALGGADTITVNDLTGTDVTRLNIDLAGAPARHRRRPGRHRHRQRHATATTRSTITGARDGFTVAGLPATVTVHGTEAERLAWSSTPWAATTASTPPACPPASSTDDRRRRRQRHHRRQRGNDVLIGGDGNDLITAATATT